MTAGSEPPFPVYIARIVGYVLAVCLIVFGIIGFAVADGVSDPFGVGLLILGVVVGGASILLGQGRRLGRDVLGALAVITFVVAVVYAFAGPNYTTGPGLATGVVTLGTIALLYLPQSSKDYFSN